MLLFTDTLRLFSLTCDSLKWSHLLRWLNLEDFQCLQRGKYLVFQKEKRDFFTSLELFSDPLSRLRSPLHPFSWANSRYYGQHLIPLWRLRRRAEHSLSTVKFIIGTPLHFIRLHSEKERCWGRTKPWPHIPTCPVSLFSSLNIFFSSRGSVFSQFPLALFSQPICSLNRQSWACLSSPLGCSQGSMSERFCEMLIL